MAPLLFFAELHLDRTATWISCLVGVVLRAFGWNELPLFCRPYSKKAWYDRNHPKVDAAVDLVSHLVLEAKLAKESWALIIGDSTSSYCVKWEDTSRKTFADAVFRQTGVHIRFEAESGTHFSSGYGKSFLAQAEKATAFGYPMNSYDAVILIGGWNEEWNSNFSRDYIYERVGELTRFCTT
jgi:hypothetical protein